MNISSNECNRMEIWMSGNNVIIEKVIYFTCVTDYLMMLCNQLKIEFVFGFVLYQVIIIITNNTILFLHCRATTTT